MFQSSSGEKTQLNILDREQIRNVLDEIHSTKPGKVNWFELNKSDQLHAQKKSSNV
jgi:hypothetical protein